MSLPRQKRIRVELDLTPQMIDQLRFLIDGLPICTYAPLIMAVLPHLPLENEFNKSAAVSPSADAPPAQVFLTRAGEGFSLHALTPKGERLLPELQRMLGRLELPHGDSL